MKMSENLKVHTFWNYRRSCDKHRSVPTTALCDGLHKEVLAAILYYFSICLFEMFYKHFLEHPVRISNTNLKDGKKPRHNKYVNMTFNM